MSGSRNSYVGLAISATLLNLAPATSSSLAILARNASSSADTSKKLGDIPFIPLASSTKYDISRTFSASAAISSGVRSGLSIVSSRSTSAILWCTLSISSWPRRTRSAFSASASVIPWFLLFSASFHFCCSPFETSSRPNRTAISALYFRILSFSSGGSVGFSTTSRRSLQRSSIRSGMFRFFLTSGAAD